MSEDLSPTDVEQRFLNLITPEDINVPMGLELDNQQLDDKIGILLERQEQSMGILKINYWDQVEKIVTDSDGEHNGFNLLMKVRTSVNENLYHHMSHIYSIRKLIEEYRYIRRNNLEYT